MLDTLPQISSLEIKGENQNIFQINFDNSENSTRESHPECENFKCSEDVSEPIKNDDSFLEPRASKKKIEKNFFLHKNHHLIITQTFVQKNPNHLCDNLIRNSKKQREDSYMPNKTMQNNNHIFYCFIYIVVLSSMERVSVFPDIEY